MTTEMISLSEYRKNISALYARSQKENVGFVVTVHGKPVWNITPITKDDVKITTKYSQDFIDELAEMERDYETGKFSGPFTKEESRAYLMSLM